MHVSEEDSPSGFTAVSPAVGPALRVALSVRNDLHRYGLMGMLQTVDVVADVVVVDDPDHPEHDDTVGAADGNGHGASTAAPHLMIVDSSEAPRLRRGALTRLKAQGTRVLWLVDDDIAHDHSQLALLLLGGCVVTRQLSTGSLREALRRVGRGETVVPESLLEALVDGTGSSGSLGGLDGSSDPSDPMDPSGSSGPPVPVVPRGVRLTPREREALGLMVEGLVNKQIARRMGISLHGAKRLVANILAKLDCDNRTHAVAKVLREGGGVERDCHVCLTAGR